MSTETAPDLHVFADWIRATDEHADYHLAMITQAEQALYQPAPAVPAERPVGLPEKIERWRYQHLHQHGGNLNERDQSLVDTLDLTANRLAGRQPRPPRQTRQAIAEPAADRDNVREALDVLDPRYPLERLIQRAHESTTASFGFSVAEPASSVLQRRMLLYAPVYLSSHCVNFCTYCGFRYPLDIPRRHLSRQQAVEQVQILRSRGFRHVLLVGGEFPQLTTTAYYRDIAAAVVQEGLIPAVEIAPQSTASYAVLAAAGVCGVTLYQETYDQQLYRAYHVRGPKSNYHWRLEALDRAAEAGMSRLGLGVLLGLADVRKDVPALMRHGAYLAARFPDRRLAFSLPRIHEAPQGFAIPHPVPDELLIRLYCALRIAFPRAELVLSTRERPELRDRLAAICITQMSAGSSTSPGGYAEDSPGSGEQFPVSDHRTPAEVASRLEQAGIWIIWTIDQSAEQQR